MTRAAFEAALDSGLLQTVIQRANEERWYTVRRNGRTQTWKRDPARFEIPIKYRLRDCVRVTDKHFNNGAVDQWFRITTEESPT
jgi:hypothetical protein